MSTHAAAVAAENVPKIDVTRRAWDKLDWQLISHLSSTVVGATELLQWFVGWLVSTRGHGDGNDARGSVACWQLPRYSFSDSRLRPAWRHGLRKQRNRRRATTKMFALLRRLKQSLWAVHPPLHPPDKTKTRSLVRLTRNLTNRWQRIGSRREELVYSWYQLTTCIPALLLSSR